jgi:hypothetical protein
MERTTYLPFIALVLFGFTDLTPEELECEIAAETLQDCCVGLEFDEQTCGSSVGCGRDIRPAFDLETSECLQELSCVQMREEDAFGETLCDRAVRALEERQDELQSLPSDGRQGPIEGLCP